MKSFTSFNFEGWELTENSVKLRYSYDDSLHFSEVLQWSEPFLETDQTKLKPALELLSLVLGISYFKAYLAPEIDTGFVELTDEQASFYNDLYQNGLGEFLYKNNLDFSEIAQFSPVKETTATEAVARELPQKALLPVSGGKDSLLTAEVLLSAKQNFRPVYVTTDGNYPKLLEKFAESPLIVKRTISPQLIEENSQGAHNGHVPFSAILDAILIFTSLAFGYSDIVLSHEASANEATTTYKGKEVNHQYSKTAEFDQKLQDYCHKYVNQNLTIFSLLGNLTELEINKLFVDKGIFDKYVGHWSSCNVANYKLGNDTSELKWCGHCSKCANAFLLMAPFVGKEKIVQLFDGKNLLEDESLTEVFEQLLGETESKPFECVAEINELRTAVKMLQQSQNWPEAEKLPANPLNYSQTDFTQTIPEPYNRALTDYMEK